MTDNPFISKYVRGIGLSLFSLMLVSPAEAVEIVAPGETVAFMQADGGVRECRAKDIKIGESPLLGCGDPTTVWVSTTPVLPNPLDFIGTGFNAAGNEVEAAFSALALVPSIAVGLPHYATGAVNNDFQIEDLFGTESVVDVQFAIKFSWEGAVTGTTVYDGRITLSVEVEDITDDPTNPIGIGSFDLASRDRQGDQGITDVATGGGAYDRNNDTASFSLKLRSGRTYRIWFKAEAYGTNLIKNVESAIRGRWSELSVTVVEDDTELILQLQEDLKQHDTDIKSAVSIHDGDIKALLATVQSDLAEIKRLLNTPPGRRPDFPLKPPR